ncbi:MAG: hypothetical protein KC478_16945 [Bacteriovoracaceae bacterium]|nr:hypothetical protein [Bacteriovoracaceae bacterium]
MSFENPLYFLSSLTLVAFLYYCIRPYFEFFRRFFISDTGETEKSALDLNPKHRILEQVLDGQVKRIRAMSFEQRSQYGDKAHIQRMIVEGIKIKITTQRDRSGIKVTVSPDSLLGPLYAVEKTVD